MELLKQAEASPMPVPDQVVSIWAATNGYLDELEVSVVHNYEASLLDYVKSHSKVIATIQETGQLKDDTEAKLKKVVEEHHKLFVSAQGRTVEDTGEVEAERTQEELVRGARKAIDSE